MILLSNRDCESISIGPNIRVTVIRTGEAQMLVGIDAPDDVTIVRHDATEFLNKPNKVVEAGS